MNGYKPVWEMVKEAVQTLDGRASYKQIMSYITPKYPGTKENTIRCQIIACTVNHPSSVYYGSKKVGISNGSNNFLFTTGNGQVEWYDPQKHGVWGVIKNEEGKLKVSKMETDPENIIFEAFFDPSPLIEEECEEENVNLGFPVESHLRDFIAKNIESLQVGNSSLSLFLDEDERSGVEYPTQVGPIDILAVDSHDNFVVFELKLSRGPDRALGQLARYMGWVKKNLANGKEVKGIIIARNVDEKLKYAAEVMDKVELYEYEMQFTINGVRL